MADPYRTAALRAGRRPNLYVPEENQEWQEGQKLIGPEAAWRRNYEFVLQQTGDPQRAEAAANSIARTERRQELTQLATSVAGPVMRGGELATGLARTVMGGSRAAEAPAAMRALPPPRRNAMYPDEMLTPDVIPMGGPSPNTPRLTYAKPETRYRMAVDRPAEGRPLTNYENPVRDQTFVAPEEMRPWSAGEVRTPVDPIAALETETIVPVSNAPKWEDFKLKDLQRAEDMKNEGGVWPTQQRTLRRLAGESEDAFRARQLAVIEDEGGGAGRQATINNLNRQAEADFRARQMGALDDEFGAITSGRNPPQPVAQALQVVERQAAAPAAAPAPGPGTGFTMIDTPGQGFTMTPPSRAVAMRTVGSEAAPMSAPASSFYSDPSIAAAAARKIPGGALPSGSYLPLFAGTTLAGTALLSGQQQARSPGQSAGSSPSGAGSPMSGIPSGYTVDDQSAAGLPRYMDTPVGDLDPKYAASIARARMAAAQTTGERAPAPPRRPEEGFFSNLFANRPATTKQLFEQSQADPSDAGAWMRAERQYARTHKDDPNFDVTKLNDQGMKRGGAAGKSDSVHKALEIIHHLISSR